MRINNDNIIHLEVIDEEGNFNHNGCNNCSNSLGNDTHDCIAHIENDRYDIELCWSCICAYHNGDTVDEQCNNIYEI